MGRSKSVPQLLPVPLEEDQPDISTPASKKTKKKKNESAQMLDPSFKDQHEISTPASKKIKLRAEESTELNTRIGKEISANSRGRPRRFGSSFKNKAPMLEGVQVIEGNKQRHKNSRGEKNGTKAASGMGAMEEKINHLIVLLEERKASEAMFSKAQQHIQIQNPSLADMKSEMRTSKYKTMYIDCEKKIKDLKHENYELRKKLEATTGKLEEYEKGQLAVSRSSHKFDNSCFASTMTKAAQAILDLSLSPRANTDDLSSPVVSREPKSSASKELKDDVVKNMSGKASGEMKRTCWHCGASKTPQWRVGPMGPRTLCNACGVRYRSGKLVPEYRPLASPSFNGQVHSNIHKKVMGNIPDQN